MTHMKTETEYIPFGEEWKKEMNKFTKEMLIDLLRKKLIELQNIKETLKPPTL